jgi:hypothetical protein
MADVEAQAWSNGKYDTAVDQATQENYKILMRHYVFNPLGTQEPPSRDLRTVFFKSGGTF